LTPPLPPPPEAPPTSLRRPSTVTVRLPIPWQTLGWSTTVLTLLAVLLTAASHVRTVTVPMVVAFAIAYIFNPVVDRIERYRVPRSLAIVLLLGTFLALSVLLGLIVGPQVAQEAIEVPHKLRQLLAQVRPWAHRLFDIDLPDSFDSMLAALQAQVAMREQAPFAGLAHRASELLSLLFGGTVSVLASLGSLLMVPLFAFFFLRDFHAILAGVALLWPDPTRPVFLATMREIDSMLSGFVRGQLIVGAILAVLYSMGFYLVHLPLALLVGIVTGLGNMVPFVGTAVGLVAATLMGLLSWQSWGNMALIYGVFVIIHVLEAWLITPRVVGGSVGLSPLLVIISILVFGELFGFFGILVAVPLAAIIKIVGRRLLARYRGSAFYAGAAPS
jgi:predicted PurR-regulated permease PerM